MASALSLKYNSRSPTNDKSAVKVSLLLVEEDASVEVSLLHKYGNINTLKFSENTSTDFAEGNMVIGRLQENQKSWIWRLCQEKLAFQHNDWCWPPCARHETFYAINCSQAYLCLQIAN